MKSIAVVTLALLTTVVAQARGENREGRNDAALGGEMKKTLLRVAVLAVAACGLANETDVDVTVEGSVLTNDKAYKQALDGKAIAAQPSWDPLEGKCPIGPSKAVQLATAKLKKAAPHLKLSSVSLEKVPGMTDKWYYMVNFFQDPESMEGDYANVIVCLDGTMPRLEKEE